ncbi:ImmA/IrrE family metallo-endopeptidase [Pseudoalteromonas sp. JC28]|uniref:helix-turn-helix domain-containing protein n=1 Tax=Pseudoalteromonas sp. JC28 TaxID=2267617 RepID=UPI001572FC55|nr:XRE family transcriptional regulator [Pseudoalteromonas sp. JC28]NSY35842.1 ImmA/IrrE family metallo-endopeptidase [Pseudoalteromonas sp. JC28]
MRAGIGGFQGARLTQAREVLGISKSDLATMVSVSPASVTNWESGKLKPEIEKVEALSRCLNQSIEWFIKELSDGADSTYFYRSMASSSRRGRMTTKVRLNWLSELTETLSKYVSWPDIRLPENSTHFLQLSDEEIESFALATREAAGVKSGPVPNMVLAIENCGAFVTRDEIGYQKIDGTSFWCPNTKRPFVFLADDKSNGCRSRFNAAHELGHLVLHKFVTDGEHKKHHAEIERQAHLFAGAFLMPERAFLSEVKYVTVESLLALKIKWKVSIAAMIMRLHHLEVIDDDQKLNLYKRLSARKWRTKEPFDDKIEFEIPRVLPRTVNLITENLMSKLELAHELVLSPHIAEKLMSLPMGYFDDAHHTDNVVELKSRYRSGNVKSEKADVVKIF